MDEIAWSEAFCIGHETIDKQHRRLVDMVNRLIANPRATTGSQTVTDVLDEMTEYVRVHFDYEERLMREIGYPQLEWHVAQHRAFEMKTSALIRSATLNADSVPVVVLNYLRDWLTRHILETDRTLIGHFN